MQIKMIVIQNRNNQSLWGKTTSWFKMFEINIIHNNHLDLAYVCVCGQKRRTNDRLQVNRISRFDCRPAKSHERLPVGTCGHRQHTISNRVNACGQKRHTSCDKNYFPSKLTNQTGQKRHSYLHTVCVLQPVQPFTPDKFEDILDAFTERRDTQAAIKRVSHRSSRIKPVRRDTVIFTPSVCSNLSSHSHRTSSKTS